MKSLWNLSPLPRVLYPPPLPTPPPQEPTGHRDRDVQISDSCNTRHINPVKPYNRSEIRRRATPFHTPHSLCDHHLPAFLRVGAFATQGELLLKYLATATFWHHGWWHFTLRNYKRVENERRPPGKVSFHSETRHSRHSTRPLLVQKCKCTCHHRAGSCNFDQSHPTRCPWHVDARLGGGGQGEFMRLVLHALARSGADDDENSGEKSQETKLKKWKKKNWSAHRGVWFSVGKAPCRAATVFLR